MNSFRGDSLKGLRIPTSTAWLLADIAESKGRQDLYTKQSPQILKALRETALVESVESSNRIEGVTVERDRLRPLVLGNARPRDRSEQEIQGYRTALNLIHTGGMQDLPTSLGTLRRLHLTIQEGVGDAGEWKTVENDIIEFRSGSAPIVRFRPVRASETLAAVGELCLSYHHVINQQIAPPLIALACFVLDFLCIHPFRDGNGRVSRLLTLLGAYQHGYEVGRYISIERLVEQSKEDYYEVLRLSSEGWHEGRHDLTPWLNYFLTVLRRAYREFEQRVGQTTSPRGAKTEMVLKAIRERVGEFKLGDIERACPGVGREWIRALLVELRKSGQAQLKGRGPGARWRYIGRSNAE